MPIKVIAFDADDTLWINEPYFYETERHFCRLLEDYLPHHTVSRELLQVEIQNLSLYGYGIKSFMLSMIETALKVSNKTITLDAIEKIIQLGKDLLAKPIELIDGVEEVLIQLKMKYRLVVATKGDLLDQEQKLARSGLGEMFQAVEIVSDKSPPTYQRIFTRHGDGPERSMMVGNSLKSDIVPAIEVGSWGIFIPHPLTWALEHTDAPKDAPRFRQIERIGELSGLLAEIDR